jgi:hypothetical protein
VNSDLPNLGGNGPERDKSGISVILSVGHYHWYVISGNIFVSVNLLEMKMLGTCKRS